MGRPTRKAARMSEWVLHCEVKQRHIRRSQPTRDAALKDACSQLLQGYSVNRIVGPNETITAERIKSWCASRGSRGPVGIAAIQGVDEAMGPLAALSGSFYKVRL
jgi:hypothetical protein